jgi:hypothetical protein
METSDLLIRVALALEPEALVRPVAESLAA